MNAKALQSSFISGIEAVPAAEWNALTGHYPFLRHEFLLALEATGCVAPATGWTPHHLLLRRDGQLLAAVPLYLKAHSWGEFVFDFAWARAFQQAGVAYYPKLLCAVPFTPATGPRVLCHSSLIDSCPADINNGAAARAADLRRPILDTLAAAAKAAGLASAHALFIDEPLYHAAAAAGWLLRSDCQFHWQNDRYRDFEHFLEGFAADKRKKARRERRRAAEQGIAFRTVVAAELDAATLDHVHALHAGTFAAHGHLPYLSSECFRRLAEVMGAAMPIVLALRGAEVVAAAVYFRSHDTLYGRYWGAAQHFNSLHFETCYYQGIDYSIREGLQRFEPGTQGEHKLARGFTPTLTWSAHWIGDPRLRAAVAEFLGRERRAVAGYAAEATAHLPFRQSPP